MGTVAVHVQGNVSALRQRDAGVLVGWVLLVHGQSLVGAAVGPDEDGGARHFAAAVRPAFRDAAVILGSDGVALVVAPDTCGGGATVALRRQFGWGQDWMVGDEDFTRRCATPAKRSCSHIRPVPV